MKPIIATFRWRLDPGKGIDLLLKVLSQLIEQSQHQREFHIFGTGSLEQELQQISKQYPQIKLYGRTTRDQIKPVAQSWHYCLCPSQLLESFGMTALEWCKLWLPVIGPAKWGLQQFIISDFGRFDDISLNWESLLKLLLYIDQNHDHHYSQRQQEILQITTKFGPSKRLQQVNSLLKPTSTNEVI
jgi:glycosyltransferase involved in cell wall biosynthesis